MTCPYCGYSFEYEAILTRTGRDIDQVKGRSPFLCSSCGSLGICQQGALRKIEPAEEEALRKSPAWPLILTAKDAIERNMLKRRARRN